jgi:protoporphyrinogen oxidase
MIRRPPAGGEEDMQDKTAVIIGAGPAGLTAAYELLEQSGIRPIVFEMSPHIGGISKTIAYKGNRIDIGGHRFFSKSDRVMSWWLHFLPLQGKPSRDDLLLQREVALSPEPGAPDPERQDRVMLLRQRLSRILFLRRFFSYPVSLSAETLANLGLYRAVRIVLSYIRIRLFPIKAEHSLEDFFVNRFGKELYRTFFKDYTEKVWGLPCSSIRPEWGAQRIKGLSVTAVLLHAVRRAVARGGSLSQKDVETSLIERFLYPKYGPGQLWEEVARQIGEQGGAIHLNQRVMGFDCAKNKIVSVRVKDESTGEIRAINADYVLSSMPVRDLIAALSGSAPEDVRAAAEGLQYRDFLTVGLLVTRIKLSNTTRLKTINNIIPDNWIYIQEKDVVLGRVQVFNNWSPYLVRDPGTVWLGLEYFCTEGDEIWSKQDADMMEFAVSELVKIGFIDRQSVLDGVVIRQPKAYPAYFGTYERFSTVRTFTDQIANLFLIGRNGMHRYNNQDHSMLSAMMAVENIVAGVTAKNNIWSVNAEQEYHEKQAAGQTTGPA